MELEALTAGPGRARIARVLRDDLPLLVRFSRAGLFLPGPSGRPRLLASVGGGDADLLGAGPSRLRSALLAPGPATAARIVSFAADAHEPAGEALVVPLALGAALVVYRSEGRWASAEVEHVVAVVRFVGRTLAGHPTVA